MKSLSIQFSEKKFSALVSVSFRLLAGVVALSVAASQTAFAAEAAPQSDAAPSQTAPASSTLDVPAGTVIPLTLVSQIKSKSTKVGDTVRAEVAFPIATGTQVAIPAGTFVEGIVTSLNKPAKKKTRYAQVLTTPPEVQIHFVRLVYANGYVASLDALNTQASNHPPDGAVSPQFNEASLPPAVGAGSHIAFYGGEGFTSTAKMSQPPYYPPVPFPSVTLPLPPLPPQPNLGPLRGLVIGLGLGIPVVLVALAAIFAPHHNKNSDDLLYDAGWQFQMTLATPLTVDAAQVSAAAALETGDSPASTGAR